MRQYLGFAAMQLQRPQNLTTQSTNTPDISDYEEIVVVSAYNDGGEGAPNSFNIQNGDDNSQPFVTLASNTATDFPISVEGTRCTAWSAGTSLRVGYLNATLGTKFMRASARAGGHTDSRCSTIILGFEQSTYDETDPEDIAWSVNKGSVSEVGEVVRID